MVFPEGLVLPQESLMERTAQALERCMDGKVLVQFDRFGQAMRNIYSLPNFHFLVPDLSICHYDVWHETDAQTPTVLSREQLERTRTKESGVSYDVPFEAQIKTSLSGDTRTPIFKVWFSTDNRQKLAQETGAIVLAISPEKRDYIEGKTHLPQILDGAGVNSECRLFSLTYPNIASVPNYGECQKTFGEVFVMQGKSIGGDGTKIIRSAKDFKLAVEKLTGAIKITEFFSGQSSNTTVVTVPNNHGGCRVFVDIPSHKPTGISETGIHETLGAGNDWSQAFPPELLQRFVHSVELLGQYLYHEFGLIGIWGVDSIWREDGVKINEINCRLQGTTEESGVNQILRNFPPFITLHMLSFLGGDTSYLPTEEQFNQETVKLASQDHEAPYYIKIKAKFDYPVKLKNPNIRSGRYQLVGTELVYIGEELATTSVNLSNQEVLLADLPLPDSICYPGSELCTIAGMTNQRIFNDEHNLSDMGEILVEATYNKFERVENEDEYVERAISLLPQFLQQAKSVFVENFHTHNLSVREKGKADFVTEVDQAIEDLFAEWIKENFPDSNLHGEENGLQIKDAMSDWTWEIDPVDGTTNYINGNPECSIVIALKHKDEPIVAICCLPLKEQEYLAVKGKGVSLNGKPVFPTQETQLSRSLLMIPKFKTLERMQKAVGGLWDKVGGVHIKMSCVSEVCDIASGKAGVGAWFGMGPHEWSAAFLFAKESGCVIAEIDEELKEFDYSGMGKKNIVITANAALFDQIKGNLQRP